MSLMCCSYPHASPGKVDPESLGLVKGSGYQGCIRTYPQVRDAEGPQSTSRAEGRTRLRAAASEGRHSKVKGPDLPSAQPQ